ncbi:MAG: secondary thiamine-phosphate synthase enzyme YjbQ [Candidatus Omnitrophica bacterium]|nr:secondary thiamine-phosphate synthase enzyme YjbQ [Candidatus Omnitrophota bacterium]
MTVDEIEVSTRNRNELVDITEKIRELVRSSKVRSGVCYLFVPHTTAGITINENADPSVKRDIIKGLESVMPSEGKYEHSEGNAAAHIKSTIVGVDKTIFIEDGDLRLGTWQGIFFCEFDGPRRRKVIVKIRGL